MLSSSHSRKRPMEYQNQIDIPKRRSIVTFKDEVKSAGKVCLGLEEIPSGNLINSPKITNSNPLLQLAMLTEVYFANDYSMATVDTGLVCPVVTPSGSEMLFNCSFFANDDIDRLVSETRGSPETLKRISRNRLTSSLESSTVHQSQLCIHESCEQISTSSVDVESSSLPCGSWAQAAVNTSLSYCSRPHTLKISMAGHVAVGVQTPSPCSVIDIHSSSISASCGGSSDSSTCLPNSNFKSGFVSALPPRKRPVQFPPCAQPTAQIMTTTLPLMMPTSSARASVGATTSLSTPAHNLYVHTVTPSSATPLQIVPMRSFSPVGSPVKTPLLNPFPPVISDPLITFGPHSHVAAQLAQTSLSHAHCDYHLGEHFSPAKKSYCV